ncbi:restriction endonuclease subunit S [Acinetobacter baumannii]|uniref:restriction endonuclease subunit S n=1 Tax=Acinetobacter baumannii TaxID=470 RepID=UPI00094C1D39|nr:restriction endonuclease subunit S [Acinetobacter baumannii]PNH13780.1 type I restriction endonuclease subunit R [Acinetobacter baumannii]UMO42009.1 restriction endonuclease subunit S [Acinetobacter baumannii]HCA4900498.1 restriction endonuclease subunit S [Acinetobacter baumannii]
MTHIVKIGDISSQIRGVSYSKNDAVLKKEEGYLPILRANNIQEQGLILDNLVYVPEHKISQKQRILSGDVIIAASSGSIDVVGKAASAKEDINAGFGAFCKILRPNTKLVDPRYFANYFQTKKYRQIISSLAAGANINNLRNEHLDDLEILLPPLSEQRRIASILDKADELRQKRQQAIEKLDQLLQATFIDMFGDPVSNPKGWDIFKSKSLFQDPPRIGTTTPAKGEGIPVVRVGELGQFSINFKECGRVQISESDFKKYELKNGDLVLARAIGSKNQLGKCSYFSEYFEPVCIDSHVMRLRPDSKKMHPLWFYFLLSSDQGKKILQSKGGATAVQFNINSAQANDLDIALPPLIEQTKFVEIANKILKNKESHIRALEANTLLFSALQNQAFSGTL